MLIIGCYFHAHFQQIAILVTTTDELVECRLEHAMGEGSRPAEVLGHPVE